MSKKLRNLFLTIIGIILYGMTKLIILRVVGMGQLSGWALRARGRISGVISGSDLLLRSGTGSCRAEYHCWVLGEGRGRSCSGVTVVTVVARQSTRCRGICDQPDS